jgi:adenosine deaminase
MKLSSSESNRDVSMKPGRFQAISARPQNVQCRPTLFLIRHEGNPVRQAEQALLTLFLFFSSVISYSQTKAAAPEQRANRYLQSVQNQPPLALAFLRGMPKGGDLHNHLGGAVYAEDLIDYAAQDKLCVDRSTMTAVRGQCDSACGPQAEKAAAACAYLDQNFYNSIIDAWSMRNWERRPESGHDHFFAAFLKFDAPFHDHIGDEIARDLERAAADHLEYLELMHTIGGMQSAQVGKTVGWNPDFGAMRDALLSGGLKDAIASAHRELDDNQRVIQNRLGCGTPTALPACNVELRYLYQVLRGLPPEQVFAQIVTGFELASSDPRVVGLNLVMPEDWYVPIHDFDLHMRMLNYLRAIYPRVHITLHAGELAMGLVPPEDLRFHIRRSIEEGHAERIGHGVSVMEEHNAVQLLREMAQRKILVEICLTSNDVILGIRGKDHPLPVYREYKVPVALATDDEGVSRSDMTHEYLRAVESYQLSYIELKQMARQSLEHSFLAGASLWSDVDSTRTVAACASANVGAVVPSSSCKRYLDSNDKARVQWTLEHDFADFEKRFWELTPNAR